MALATLTVEWLTSSRGSQLDVVNAALAPLGRQSDWLWECQHSCSDEQIKVCTEMNCEAAARLSDEDEALLLRLVRARDWRPFAVMTNRWTVSGPAAAILALKALADATPDEAGLATALTPSATPDTLRLVCDGSPVAFAALCARSRRAPPDEALGPALQDLYHRAVFLEVPEVATALVEAFR